MAAHETTRLEMKFAVLHNVHIKVKSFFYFLLKSNLSITFDVKLNFSVNCSNQTKSIKYCMDKGNYEMIRKELLEINWGGEMQNLPADVLCTSLQIHSLNRISL